MAYCSASDLLTGDIPLPPRLGDGSGMISYCADEMDAQIGHMYKTPVDIDLEAHPEHRPTVLLLKTINVELATGRLLMEMAAGGQDEQTHSYGRYLIGEGIKKLSRIINGTIVLGGAERVDGEEGPAAGRVIHEDSRSLVEAFYVSEVGAVADALYKSPTPYDLNERVRP